MLMKNFLLLLLASVSLISYADPDEIVIIQDDPIKNRSGIVMPLDQPCVYYDDETQTIIIDGGGAVSYYDVEISSATTGAVEMTTTVSGTYDTFNISSLSAGTHVITIESPSGNTFEGTCFYKS